MSSLSAITVRNLVKHYGKIEALKGVSLSVGAGEIYGLLGRNGAGKTTMVKTLLGIVGPTAGEALLFERPIGDSESRRSVGYLPEDHRFPDYHTARTALEFYGALSGVSHGALKTRIPEVLGLVGMESWIHTKIRKYSKGMKQRLGLAQAILHDPQILFLDEPTDGVDPVGRKSIREMIQHWKSRGKTIFLNSHLLSEVEMICDRVGILDKGVLLKEGTVEELTRSENTYLLKLKGNFAPCLKELEAKGIKVGLDGDEVEVVVPREDDIDGVVDFLRARGIGVRSLTYKRLSLEDIFIETIVGPEKA